MGAEPSDQLECTCRSPRSAARTSPPPRSCAFERNSTSTSGSRSAHAWAMTFAVFGPMPGSDCQRVRGAVAFAVGLAERFDDVGGVAIGHHAAWVFAGPVLVVRNLAQRDHRIHGSSVHGGPWRAASRPNPEPGHSTRRSGPASAHRRRRGQPHRTTPRPVPRGGRGDMRQHGVRAVVVDVIGLARRTSHIPPVDHHFGQRDYSAYLGREVDAAGPRHALPRRRVPPRRGQLCRAAAES